MKEKGTISVQYAFSHSSSLKKHIKTVHEGEKKHRCTICDKTFSMGYSLKKHIKTVHERERSHICTICDKAFSMQYDLKRPIKIVHAFIISGNLKKHIKAGHGGSA